MKTTKISKILLIIAIILAIVTIGMFFYKNSCYQEYRRYGNNHSSDDMKLKNRQITQSNTKISKKNNQTFTKKNVQRPQFPTYQQEEQL